MIRVKRRTAQLTVCECCMKEHYVEHIASPVIHSEGITKLHYKTFTVNNSLLVLYLSF